MQKWFGGLVIVGAFAIAAAVGTIANAQQPMPSACPSASPAAFGDPSPAPSGCPSMSPAPSGTMSPAY